MNPEPIVDFITSQAFLTLVSLFFSWALTQGVKKWKPGLDKGAIPPIAGTLATIVALALVAAINAITPAALPFWATVQLGLSAGMGAVMAHYSPKALGSGTSYVIAWLQSAHGQK